MMSDLSWGRVSILGVVLLALVFRLIGLGSFMTADEPNWMIRSAQFWHEMASGNPGGTFITTHPGATAMWLIGAGEVIQEKRIGMAVDTSTLAHFRLAATLPMAAVTAALIGVVTFFLMQLWRGWPGIAAGFLLTVEPYLTGMSQIAHLDALFGLLLVAAVCSLLLGLKGKRVGYIVFAGILLGLAAGTKLLPSLVFLPWAALAASFLSGGSGLKRLYQSLRILGMLIGLAGLTFFIIWPALWVKDDLAASVGRDAVTVVTVAHSDVEDGGQDVVAPASFYIRTILGRTTPFVLIVSLGAAIVLAKAALAAKPDVPITQLSVTWMIVFALAFLLMISLVAKKSDRYALPALAVLPLMAAWVCAGVWRVYMTKWAARGRLLTGGAAIIGIVLVLQAILATPYAIAYNSVLFSGRPLSQQGWGEGLDEAARWLNEHPLKEKLTVASWYPNVLATHFSGTTFSLSSRNDPRVGYVVLYRNMLGRGQDEMATNVWDEYRERSPAHIISIGGVPYVWIFETFGVPYFPKNTGELLPGMEVGQTVMIERNGWDRVDVGLATFSGRAKDADIILHVRETIDASQDIRSVRKTASEIADSDWNTFSFEPIADSAGRTYYVALTTSQGKEGNTLTIRYTDDDIKPGQMLWRRRELRQGEKPISFLRPGDIAYRVHY